MKIVINILRGNSLDNLIVVNNIFLNVRELLIYFILWLEK